MRGSQTEHDIQFPFPIRDDPFPPGCTIPGSPLIPSDDQAAIWEFLQAEVSTVRLKKVYGMLFLASNRNNISPLHHQQIKGRKICMSERPDLHLTWYYDRIFVKPVPKCLLSSSFWERHLLQTRHTNDDGALNLWFDVLGFLRTYSRLIVHESDLDVAKDFKLVPDVMTWDSWCHFIQPFKFLKDREVSERYHYGEIRLTRLNFCHRLRYGCSYFEMGNNYATFFARFGAPYIFVFGAVAVILTALQTGLATYPQWGIYHSLSSSIVPLTMIIILAGLGLLPLIFLFYQLKELFFFVFSHQELS